MSIRLVLLDRDGVINEEKDGYVRCPKDLAMIPGSVEAIKILNKANLLSVIVTNQGAIGREIIDIEVLNKIHDKLNRTLERSGASVNEIIFCQIIQIGQHDLENLVPECFCKPWINIKFYLKKLL